MYDIYHSDQNDQWRYTLGRSGARPLLVIGLNPSTATQEKLDPTVTRVEKVAQQCGFDGFVMLNLYPVRATDPKDLTPKVDAVAYERNEVTNARLEAAGIEVVRIAGSELGSGRGGPRCMSCPVARAQT